MNVHPRSFNFVYTWCTFIRYRCWRDTLLFSYGGNCSSLLHQEETHCFSTVRAGLLCGSINLAKSFASAVLSHRICQINGFNVYCACSSYPCWVFLGWPRLSRKLRKLWWVDVYVILWHQEVLKLLDGTHSSCSVSTYTLHIYIQMINSTLVLTTYSVCIGSIFHLYWWMDVHIFNYSSSLNFSLPHHCNLTCEDIPNKFVGVRQLSLMEEVSE